MRKWNDMAVVVTSLRPSLLDRFKIALGASVIVRTEVVSQRLMGAVKAQVVIATTPWSPWARAHLQAETKKLVAYSEQGIALPAGAPD